MGFLKSVAVLSVALLLSFSVLINPSQLHAAPRGPFSVDPDQVFTVTDGNGKTITCVDYQNEKMAGTMVKDNKFMPAENKVDTLRKKLKAAKKKQQRTLIKTLKRKIVKMKEQVEGQNALCRGEDAPGGGGGDPTPTPTPIPSLNKLSRQMTREDVRYLLEKAGFGLSSREEYLVDIGVNQGVEALVTEFMSNKAEESGLLMRVADRLDAQLGTTTTQTPSGQRQALLDLWAHTNNPYTEKFALFLLSIWTVSGDVIGDETFRFAFWDYFTRLRTAAAGSTNLPQLALDITRDPLMLVYLSNELNIRGNPNENYARELMELFTLGPADLDGNPNYTETAPDGSGDIAVAARMLTGWSVVYNYQTVTMTSRSLSYLHEPGPHTMFADKPYKFTGEDDEDLVNGIFANHPGVKIYYAKEILKEYLTPNPSRELIEGFAQIIAQNNYNLRPAMAVLLQSEAFYSDEYKDTVPKNSSEFAVELIKLLDLEDACNYSDVSRQVTEMGMEINNAPSVFWYNPAVWLSPSILLEKANLIHQLLGDTTSQRAPEPDWTIDSSLPSGPATVTAVITHVMARMGLGEPSADQLTNIGFYMNRTRNYNNTYSSVPYSNTDATLRLRKGAGLYYILAGQSKFQLK